MPGTAELLKQNMTSKALAVFVLNVGDGDAIIVRFPPAHGKNTVAIVDCYNANKTIAALKKLKPDNIAFICATHPHYDHTKGIADVIHWCNDNNIPIEQFWDSGFRHVSKTHYDLIRLLGNNNQIEVIRPTSGFETIINKVQITVLSPSIYLKNRYDTYGTNINNASIVLKLTYPPVDIASYYLTSDDMSDEELSNHTSIKQNTIILGGDAQFDAWAHMTQEFPELQHTDNRGQLIDSKTRKFKPLRCQVLKAPHHMSKHSISLEVAEKLRPRFTIASCAKKSRHGFPHELTVLAIEDIHRNKNDDGIRFTGHRNPKLSNGTIAVLCRGDQRKPLVYCLKDKVSQNAPL